MSLTEEQNFIAKTNPLKSMSSFSKVMDVHYEKIQTNPNLPWDHFLLGEGLVDLGFLDEAITLYQKAVELSPDSDWFQIGLGKVLQKQGKHQEAINLYNKLGLTLLSAEKLTHAIACYRAGIEFDAESWELHHNVADALQRQGEIEEAIAHYQQAIAINPSYSWSHHNLGWSLIKQGKIEEAISYFREAIEIAPEEETYQRSLFEALNSIKASIDYYNSGCLQKKAGKLSDAIDNFRKAIELNPNLAFLYHSLGDALIEKKAYVEAIACFRKATEIEPQFAFAFHRLGDMLQNQGAIDDAINAYKRTITLKSDHFPSYLHLGNALFKNIQDTEAENCYRKALKLNPSSHLVHCDLGYALTRQNKLKEAIHHYQKASRLIVELAKPDYVQSYWESGKIKGPDFAILGAQKSGTTSLYEYIAQHPHFLPSIRKEIDFFSLRYDKGIDWYLSHFPPIPDNTSYFTGEASTSNLDHPQVAERFYQHFPNIKFIALLRNPVDRAFSHYNHVLRFHPNEETRTFEEAVEEEIDFIDRLDKSEILEIVAKKAHRGYLLRGLYFYYIQQWMTVFPREKFLILKSEDFYVNSRKIMEQVFEFLEVSPHHSDEYAKYNSGYYSTGVSQELRLKLSDFFCTYNSQLEEYLQQFSGQ